VVAKIEAREYSKSGPWMMARESSESIEGGGEKREEVPKSLKTSNSRRG
jgi:hypothetical protein